MNRGRASRQLATAILVACACISLPACSNDPYPPADQDQKILYSSFAEAPRTLDPAIAYTTVSSVITGNVFDTLLEYHYRVRPFKLMGGLATSLPEGKPRDDGKVVYRFNIRDGIEFHEDVCFKPNAALGGRRTRPVTAQDFAFQLMRIADANLNSPVRSNFEKIHGLKAFSKSLTALRAADAQFAKQPVHEQYAQAGGIAGINTPERLTLEIILDHPDPQILYWFAMPFTTPMAWEAVAYYDGNEGRDRLDDHPVGTGPFILANYDKQFRMTLVRNPHWYGARFPQAPGVAFPREGNSADIDNGTIDPTYLGKAMPFLARVEFRRARESIPRFNNFLQGYYDSGGIVKESFDTVIENDRLSPAMAAQGMRLDKTVEPSVFYIGFNMDDSVVGRAGGDRSRKLRQAMSLVIDTERYLELFQNKRGVPAQSVLPPGIFGYDPQFRNQYRKVDIARARKLLAEAGYTGGIDPKTSQPLKLNFDTGNTSTQAKLQYQFFVDAWRKLGIDVTVSATNYNQFQAKVRRGAYQIFTWGWIADYPDPENFLFLLHSAMARSTGNGPNTSNFKNAAYDKLFDAIKDRPNDPERQRLIVKMIKILENERPWIELNHRESYLLSHSWLKNAKPTGLFVEAYKYLDVDPKARAEARIAWNQPTVWPAYLLLAIFAAAVLPGIVTFYKERQ